MRRRRPRPVFAHSAACFERRIGFRLLPFVLVAKVIVSDRITANTNFACLFVAKLLLSKMTNTQHQSFWNKSLTSIRTNDNGNDNNKNDNSGKTMRLHCVSLDLQPKIYPIESRRDFSAEEIDQTWYCHLELEAMVAAAMDPANERNLHHAGGSRGLEKYTAAGSTRLEIHRVQVVAAVLREQQRQKDAVVWKVGRDRGADLIAQASIQLSRECQELAYIQGYNDEVEAWAGTDAVKTDVVSIPKPSLFKQFRAMSDMIFLERNAKQAKTANQSQK